MIKADIVRLQCSYFPVAIQIDDFTNLIVGFRIYTSMMRLQDHPGRNPATGLKDNTVFTECGSV